MKHSRALCLLTIALLLGGCSGVVDRKYSTHGQDDPPSSEVVSDAVVVARSPLSAFQRAKGLRVTGQLDMDSSAALAR